MNRCGRIIWLVGVFLLSFSGIVFAQEDVRGCKDHPMFTRMENFYIEGCKEEKFNTVDFRDEKGKRIKVEGKVYKIDYAIKEGFTPPSALQVIRNYENAIKKIGGSKVYEEEYEIWLKLDKAGKTFWVYVDSWHGGGAGETYGITIVEKESMVQEVVANAKSLARDISSTGHASVYGIHFDFNKTTVKPESEPTLKEIAKLLKQNPKLNLYVVGHTDSVGKIDYNMQLSNARAKAIVKALITKYGVSQNRLSSYGVGPLAPVASNETEEGRALNRRVELVKK